MVTIVLRNSRKAPLRWNWYTALGCTAEERNKDKDTERKQECLLVFSIHQ